MWCHGLHLRPIRFEPTFQKHAGQSCGGLYLHPTDPAVLRSYDTTLRLLQCIQSLWPADFAWNPPPYEYEETLMPIDILTGSSQVRELLPAPHGIETLCQQIHDGDGSWQADVRPHLQYAD